jgi:2-polyprenyl-3-methyl-5-hydroxy-6-metoxy-1,4-benzoquinol methylase
MRAFREDQCPFCLGTESKLALRVADQLFDSDRLFRLVRCNACDGVFLSGRQFESVEEYYRIAYPASYHDGTHGVHGTRDIRRHNVDRMISHRKKLRVLDVGAGAGTFLKYMQKRGHTVSGIEMNAELAQRVSSELTAPVFAGPLEQFEAREQFDLITLWDVLEHMIDPLESLRKLKSMLTPKGSIVIGVPDFHSMEAKLLGAMWFGLEVPRHTIQCTPTHVAMLARGAGLDVAAEKHALGRSYVMSSFCDARLAEERKRIGRWSARALHWGTVLSGNSGYLLARLQPC